MKLAEFLAKYVETELTDFVDAGFDSDDIDYETIIQAGIEAFIRTEQTGINVFNIRDHTLREQYS